MTKPERSSYPIIMMHTENATNLIITAATARAQTKTPSDTVVTTTMKTLSFIT